MTPYTSTRPMGATIASPGRDPGELSIVFIGDDPGDATSFSAQVAGAWPSAISLAAYTTVAELEAGLGDADAEPDAVFCGLARLDPSGIDVIERVVSITEAPVIVVSRQSDLQTSTLALQHGAQDFFHHTELNRETLAHVLRHCAARRSANLETRRVADEARRTSKELDQFAGVVAHDLRAPLRSARLLAGRLVVETGKGNETVPIEEALEDNLARMEVLVSRLLTMASIRDQGISPIQEKLSTVLADVETDLADTIHEAKATIECEADGLLFADPLLMRELFANLVHNSIQFRSPEREPRVVIGCTTDGRGSQLHVVDNGIGVPEHYRDRIFGLFERLSTDGPTSAVGFGLARCRQIVEHHNGSIAVVEPRSKIGTEVQVRLPAHR